NNYEDFYGRRNGVPNLSTDILTEVIKLFEETGSVFKISGYPKDPTSDQQIEVVSVKAEEVLTNDIIENIDKRIDFKIQDNTQNSDEYVQPTTNKIQSGLRQKRKIKNEISSQGEDSNSGCSNNYQDNKTTKRLFSIPNSSPEGSLTDYDEESKYEDKPMKIFNQNFGVTNILGTCTFCNQKYLKSELEKHISTHGKKKRHREKNLICEFCGKFFANHSRMEQHKIIHSSDRCYKCDVEGCFKTFKWRNSFEKHKMRHTDNIVKEFKCDLCEKAFMYSYMLRKHIIDIHEPPQAIKCKCCNKTFTRKETFMNHMKIHEGAASVTEADKGSKG
uniref:C2H2-type domain-containing protein n=1 Tax=Phlebotomus papatasi TaxID=29031 RepID=A0A1B0DDU7_PHLPP